MRSLGNYTAGVVSGSVGVGTFFYKGNKIGGSFQYGFNNGGSAAALIDAGYSYKVEDAFQTPTKKQTMGSTKQRAWFVSGQMYVEDAAKLDKTSISYKERYTNGIEYIQELDQSFDVAEWVTLAKYVRSNYSYKSLDMNYEYYVKDGAGYNWKFGLDYKHSKKADEYILPAASLKAENAYFNVYAKKNFNLCSGKSALLAGLNFGMNENVKGEYNYTGSYDDSDVVKDMYASDIRYMSSDYVTFGGELTYSTLVSNVTSLFVKGACKYYSPSEGFDKRVYTSLSVGITF